MQKAKPQLEESDFPKISNPALRALHGAGYTRLSDLTQISEDNLFKLHGIGLKALETLRQALSAKGLSFADKTKD